MKNITTLLTFFIIVFTSTLLYAVSDNEQISFSSITTKDGLSQNDVNCILQDNQGFMWFGTYDGLNRYDGYEFISYRYKTDSNKGLNSNLIHSIAEDKQHNIWVGTDDRGLSMIRQADEVTIDIQIPFEGKNLLDKKLIINIDIIDDLCIILTKDHIYFLRIEANTYTPLTVEGKYFVNTKTQSARCYQRISNNEFAIGTTNGLHHYTFEKGDEIKIKRRTYEWKMSIASLTSFRDGILVSGSKGFQYFDKNFKPHFISNDDIQCLIVEPNNTVWAGSSLGLHQFIFEDAPSVKIAQQNTFTADNTNGGMESNGIKSINIDRLGIIWAGTEGGGVTKLIKRSNKFKLYNNELSSQNLRENNISALFEDSQQNLWVGTDKGGITYFDASIRDYNIGGKEIINRSDIRNNVLAFHEFTIDNETYVVVGTHYPLNVQLYNTKGEEQINNPHYKVLRKLRHPIFTMASDDTYLWLGTYEGGLYRYNYHTHNTAWLAPRTTEGLSSKIIRSLYNDSKNRLWIGTDKGLNLLSPEEKAKAKPRFRVFTNAPGDNRSIGYDYILPITETSHQEIWIGTLGGGLNKFNEESYDFDHITVKDGLPNDNIKGILEDKNQKLWVASNKGLSSIDLGSKTITNFSVSDGLQDYEFREMSYAMRANGEMLFGGNNGFNSFYAEHIMLDSSQANIVFTEMETISPSGVDKTRFNKAQLANFIDVGKDIRLPYSENSFTAYFTALHFFAPDKIKYKYRLEGFEHQWNEIAANVRFAKYTNLNPGNYTLEILATNSDGVWKSTPLRLPIVIQKPWYSSALAYTVYTLLIFAIFFFFNRYSLIRNKIKHELLMERFEKEKVKELTQIKLRFFTNISHELRTPLTIIKSYFDTIAPNWKSLPQEKVDKDIAVINRNVNSLLRLISQILDFRKLEQDKMELMPTENDIVAFVQSIITSFDIVATNKNITLKSSSSSENIALWFDKDKMEKIINNILSNAIKYTPEGGEVDILISEQENTVKIEIKDNGIGIPKDLQSNIFDRFYQAEKLQASPKDSTGIGLSLTKGLVDLHHAKITLVSETHKGSNFILTFPKGKEHFSASPNVIEEPQHTQLIPEFEDKDNPIGDKHKGKTILVVEDNYDLRSFLVEELQKHFKVESASDGQLGLEKCLLIQPDIIISDVMMPNMSGYELCEAIKNDEKCSHIPIILLTAKTSEDAKIHGFKLGADAYVSKPFNMEELSSRVVAILESREKVWKKIANNPFFNPSEVSLTTRDEEFLHKVTSLIEKQMSDPDFTVEQLAALYGISKLNLNKKIKALTGKTSVQFIRLTRIRRAAQLLKEKHNRVSDVTYEVGYSDLQHFREHFKKEFSLSPSAYKKENSEPA